jgi:hypothetical protein
VKPKPPQVWLLATTVVAALCALGVGWWSGGARQPSYEGRTLQAWLCYGFGAGTHQPGADEEAAAALQYMGTAALPYLLKELGAKEPPLVWRVVYFINGHQRLVTVDYTPACYRRSMAASGLQALGKAARSALPTLRRYSSDPELKDDAKSVMESVEAESQTTQEGSLTNGLSQ